MTIPPSKVPPAAIVCAAERTEVPEDAGREPPEEPDEPEEEPLVDVALVVADDPEEAVLVEPDDFLVDVAALSPPEDSALPESEPEELDVEVALAASVVALDLEDFLVVVDLDDFLVVVFSLEPESTVLEAFAWTSAAETGLMVLDASKSQSRLSMAGTADTLKASAKAASWIIQVFILMMAQR